MPIAHVNGIDLYFETTGDGPALVFCHEFGGDYRSWEPQVRFFDRLYRCVTYSQRGFPPSSIPNALEDYSQDLLIEDLRALVSHLNIQQAFFVGFSMGGSVVLNFALKYPDLCRGIVVVGTGAGSTNRERFENDIRQVVDLIRQHGMRRFADAYAEGPIRQPFKRKDPYGWAVFRDQLAAHAADGQAFSMQGVMLRRPTIFSLDARLRQLNIPTLVAIGDEDEPCVDVAVFLKRTLAAAGLLVVPQSGHAINLEEPATFNASVLDFLRMVEADRWPRRAGVTTAMLPS
ncbi:MAG: alpha/beta hydrolase [Actinobacteria bacterium]|nr:alpha/beta hydrolase [Actinomycetota bacterium]